MTGEDLEYFYAERAAILQFDGGWPKEKAEALAKAEMETWAKALPMIAEEVDAIKKTRESVT